MRCKKCNTHIQYTANEIINQAKSSGLYISMIDYCINAFECCFPQSNSGRLILNWRLLKEAVGHCICDQNRLSSFRDMHHCDEHKRAAYLTKWISKIKPINLVISHSQNQKDPDYSTGMANANELYSVWLGYTALFIPFKRIPVHYTKNLIYHLHLHHVDADFLASEYFLLDRCYSPRYKSNTQVPIDGIYAVVDSDGIKKEYWQCKKGDPFPQTSQNTDEFKVYFHKRVLKTEFICKGIHSNP